eukprot:1641075-Alexandrium_andersonii.AAC.1
MGDNCWRGEPPTSSSTPPSGTDRRTWRSGSAPPSRRCQTLAQALLARNRGPSLRSLRHQARLDSGVGILDVGRDLDHDDVD